MNVIGNEQYVVIGNFYYNAGTPLQMVNPGATIDGEFASYYYIEDVWVSPDTIAWGDDTICENDSSKIWAFTCNDFSYAWSSTPSDPSLTGHESDSAVFVSPDVTTLYQVIVTDYYNNIDTGYVTITVLNAPDNATLSGPISKCDDPGVFTIENFDSAVQYAWSTDDVNFTITPTGSFSVDWGSDLNTGYLYVLSTDTSTGCSTFDSLLVYQCCSDTSSIVWADTSMTFNHDTLYDADIIIKGTVYINGFLNISHTDILMNPEAELIIRPGSELSFEKDTVIPCGDTYMWNSITVSDSTSKFTALGSSFRGGKKAIVSKLGGIIELYDCKLIDNYVGIHYKPYSATNSTSIANTTFQCTDAANMLLPYAGLRSYAGIVIDSVEAITIGVPDDSASLNIFDNLDYGIKSTASNLSVFNNTFQNLALPGMPYLPPGYGIYSENQTATAKALVVGTSAAGTYNDNTFMHCHTGVYVVKNQDVSIMQNTFDFTGHTAVYFERCLANTISIEFNSITRGIYGIYGRYLRRYSNNNILHNTITISSTGICIENDILAKAPLNILFNDIESPAYIGIKTTNINNSADVSYNNILFSLTDADMNNPYFGIVVQNSPKIRLYGNTLNNVGTTISTNPYNLQGISVQTTTEADLCDNDATKLGYGVCFTGYCNSSKIKRTDMTSCYTGIRLESATIGTQGLSTQPWDNRWYTNAGPYRITGTPITITNWYYRSSANQYFITPYSITPPININPLITNPSLFFSCGMIPLSSNLSTASLPDSNKNDLYYADLNLLRSVDESQAMETVTVTTTPDISLIEKAVSAFEEGDSTVFEEKTDSIISSELQAINHVTVNEILVRFAESGVLTASDSIVLLDIAYQDPIEGGEAVYTAQVLMGIMYIPVYPDVNDRSAIVQLPENKLVVYPNPADRELIVELPCAADYLLQVFSIDGKLVISTQITAVETNHSVDVSKLEKGLYRLIVTDIMTGSVYNLVFAK